jgi:hypothetical protein
VNAIAATATAVRGVLREDNFMKSSELKKECCNEAGLDDTAN